MLIANTCKLKQSKLISLVLLLVNPIISFLFSVLNYCKGRDTSLVLAISLSIILCYFPIMYDTSSNFFAYYYNESKEISNFYLIFVTYMRDVFGVQYYQVVMFYTFLTLYFWFKTINYLYRNSRVSKSTLCMMIIAFSSLNYRDLMDLSRNSLSFSMAFYSVVYIYQKKIIFKKLLVPLLAVLSIGIHIASVVIWFSLLVSKIINISHKKYRIIIMLSLFLGVFMPFIFQHLSGFFSAFQGGFLGRISYYLYSSKFGVQEFTLGVALKKLFNVILLLITGFTTSLALKQNGKDGVLKFIMICVCIALTFASYVTFFERLVLMITIFYPYVILKYEFSINLKKLQLFLIVTRTAILTLLIYFPIFLGPYKDVLPDYDSKINIMLKPFYNNTLYLIDIDNGYSDFYLLRKDKWIFD